jgi:hypothetical protein
MRVSYELSHAIARICFVDAGRLRDVAPQVNEEVGDPSTAVAGVGRRSLLARLTAGGTDGNEQLTAITGVVLILMLAALGVTILRVGQLLDAHMFIGMLLLGPVALKMASTGYRFARYYTSNPAYRRKGPPAIELRLLAPAVVVTTVVVFATGVALLFVGPASRGVLAPLHKVSFIVWLAVTALHVLGHLAGLPAALAADRRRSWDTAGSGRGARALLIAGAIVGGLVIALLTESQFGAWAHFHHHG